MEKKNLIKAITPLLAGLVIILIPIPQGLSQNAWYYFALFVTVITGVILEPLPAAAIGLLGVSIATAFRLVYNNPSDSIRWALSGFSNTTVWLIFAAYTFALGFSVTGLGRRIALLFVKYLGKNTLTLGYAIALTDLILSPYMPSNTARSGGTIYPIIRNIPEIYGSQPDKGPSARKIGGYIMWTAFAITCVTSSMFITSLAPNALALSLIRSNLNVEISWIEWFMGFLPVGIILFIATPVLAYLIYPPEIKKSPEIVKWADEELKRIGSMTLKEIAMLVIVILSLALWIGGGDYLDATTVAIMGISFIVLLGITSWENIIGYKNAWNVLVWFATLVTMADGLSRVGFVSWLAKMISPIFSGQTVITTIIITITLFYFLHYLFASLTAHATALLPTFLLLLANLGGYSSKAYALLLSYTLGIMGVISPYATGPSPIYYGSGYIDSKKFWQLGLIFGLIYFLVYIIVGVPWILRMFQ